MKQLSHTTLLLSLGTMLCLSSCGEKSLHPGAKWEAWERVNHYDALGHTPLVNAIISDAPLEVIKDLCEAGADVNLVNKANEKFLPRTSSYPPVFHAMYKQNTAVIDLLLGKGAKPCDKDGITLLYAAVDNEVRNELPPVVTKHLIDNRFDINEQTKEGEPPLAVAVYAFDIPMITLLLEKGADPHVKMEENLSVLEFAYKRMQEPPHHLKEEVEQMKSIYNLLLKHSKKTLQ